MTWEELEKIESYLKQNGLNIKEVVWEEKKPYLCDSQNIDSWNEKEKLKNMPSGFPTVS